MSGVYIKSMETPKGCAFCKIKRRNGKKMVCPFTSVEWDFHDPMSADFRLDDCPLIPVPGHGDLIDRDALLADTTDMLHSMMVFGGARVYTSDAIKNAPTIIPADYADKDGRE